MALDVTESKVWLALPREVVVFGLDGTEQARLAVPDVVHLAAEHGELWAGTPKELLTWQPTAPSLRGQSRSMAKVRSSIWWSPGAATRGVPTPTG